MATGELVRYDQDDLPWGTVVTGSGRVSVAVEHTTAKPDLPFSVTQLTRLDEAITRASRFTGLGFSVYLGELGEDTRARAVELHDSLGELAAEAVLLAVSPGQRKIEIVTGENAARRVNARFCNLAVNTMRSAFHEGDLIGGLIDGIRILCDQAGPEHKA